MQQTANMPTEKSRGISILDRPFFGMFSITWETAAYMLLITITAVMHFWDLGARALHHDESLHAIYSWYLYVGRGYFHDPMMHGPFQFHFIALMYLLFGASDYTARIMPAIAGTSLVFLPYFLRRYLTPAGALFAAVMLAFSPSVLYFGRFARGDIYMEVWTLGLVICMLRYLQEKRNIYLYVGTGMLALDYATKETTFITVAIFGSFLVFIAFREILSLLTRKSSFKDLSPAGILILVIGSFTLPQLAPIIGAAARAFKIDSPQIMPVLGLNVSMNALMAGILVGVLIAITVGLGTNWNRRTWLVCAAVFYAIYILLYSTFFTNIAGIGTGMWGSLDYWLAQHDVQRGGQPWYYYWLLLIIYDFLPLGFALVGAVYYSVRRSFFTTFLIYWIIGAQIGYAIAGEKMPWLVIHLTVPLILLAAKFLGDLYGNIDWNGVRKASGGYFLLSLPLAFIGIPAAYVGATSARGGMGGAGILSNAFVGVVVVVLVGAVYWSSRRLPRKSVYQLSALCVFVLAFGLTVRAAWTASYYNGDIPVEMLVYTQTSPDVPKVMDEIEQLSLRTTGGKDLKVTVDATDSFTWPWAWYLRDYKNVDYPTLSNMSGPPIGSVLILNASNVDRAKPYLTNYGPGQKIRHRWWFPEDYRGLTVERFVGDFLNGANWQKWVRYFLYRETPSALGSVDAVVYFPKDASTSYGSGPSADIPPEYTTKLASWKDLLVFGAKGQGNTDLNQPTDIKVDAAGNIFVVDSRNNRLQKFDPNGQLLAQIGGPAAGAGDGEFKEPWGMAIDKSGNIYVADTWNHRIQKFDSNLKFVTKWGEFLDAKGETVGNGGKFYGPRAIAIDAEGNLYVTDTGNKRIQKFDSNGKFLSSFGVFGSLEGQFSEPVGIDVDKNGNIFVADTWNHRIQRFDKDFKFVSQIPVSGWESTGIINKPYLTLDNQGNILVTDPENHRLLKFTGGGTLLAVVNRFGSAGNVLSYPIGVATDPKGSVYVTDSGSGRVLKLEVPK